MVFSEVESRFVVTEGDLSALRSLQNGFRQCVVSFACFVGCFFVLDLKGCVLCCDVKKANGLGLQAETGSDYCRVTLRFPSDTVPKWVCLFIIFFLVSFCIFG